MDNLLRILRDYPDAMECIVGGETEKDPDSTVSVYREADREYQVAEENPYDYVVEGNTMRFVGDGSN